VRVPATFAVTDVCAAGPSCLCPASSSQVNVLRVAVLAVAVRVPLLAQRGVHEMELAVAHAALAGGLAGERAQRSSGTAQHGDLQAAFVVEMDVRVATCRSWCRCCAWVSRRPRSPRLVS